MKPAVSIAHPKVHNANAVNSCKRFIVFSTDLYFPQISQIITDKRISVNQCNQWEVILLLIPVFVVNAYQATAESQYFAEGDKERMVYLA